MNQQFMLNSLLVSQDEQKALQEMEQAKKQGHSFIKVISDGDITRIHSIDIMRITENPSPVWGKPTYNSHQSTGVLEFKANPINGNMEADVLDTEYNRFFLARHIPWGLRVVDEKTQEKIAALQSKEYKMDMTEEEEITRRIRELEKEKKRLVYVRSETEKRDKEVNVRHIKDRSLYDKTKEALKQTFIAVPKNTTEGV